MLHFGYEELRHRTLLGLKRELAFAKARSIDKNERTRRRGREDVKRLKIAIELKKYDIACEMKRYSFQNDLEKKYECQDYPNTIDGIRSRLAGIRERLLSPPKSA